MVEFAGYVAYTKLFDALSHPMRIKILSLISHERKYVSELAKLANISRPLLYMHLKKLEEANLVKGTYEISDSGKSMKFYQANLFEIKVNLELLQKLDLEIPLPEPK